MANEPLDLIRVDDATAIGGELPQRRARWLVEQISEEDPNEDRWDVSSMESCC